MPFDATIFRSEFPFFARHPELTYLDSAATTQKPAMMFHRLRRFYEDECGNVHRGMHPLAEAATVAYEEARKTVARFLNAEYSDEIIFTKSCTESINVVARCWAAKNLKVNERILLTMLEHHSNIVPWFQLPGVKIDWIDIDDEGNLLKWERAFGPRTKLLAITGQSNILGTRPDLRTIIAKAHNAGAKVLVDAAQLVGHGPIDVQSLDCDFLAFSGHKLFAPFGIGVLYVKRGLQAQMSPWLGGGMMIREVTTEGFTPDDPPARFEGGTPPIAEAVTLAAVIEAIFPLPSQGRGHGGGFGDFEKHEQELLAFADHSLRSIPYLTILGPTNPHHRFGCISFTIDGVHPHDLTEILGRKGICLRAGHHCTQPLHKRLGITASTRLSVAPYNTIEEIERVVPAIEEAIQRLSE